MVSKNENKTLDLVEDTKGKIKVQKALNRLKGYATMAVAGLSATFLPSCVAPSNNLSTRYGQEVTQVTISLDGRQKTTTRSYNEFNIKDAARSFNDVTRGIENLSDAYADFRRSQFKYR